MQKSHAASVTKLLNAYLEQFSLKTIFDEHEVEHWLLPRKDIISTYVIEKPENATEVTDMVSFYTLPSSILGHPKYKTLKAAYSFYNVATTIPLTVAIKDALILAKLVRFVNLLNV
jgi:glycylpeptide N-tetradecanoyltransferase